MGTKRIQNRSDGIVIDDDWFNSIRAALLVDLVSRTSGGVVTADIAELGRALYRWKQAFVAEGYFALGDFKLHHSYNGILKVGQGWMLCDGREITEANYNLEHSSGDWATYIGTSPLAGKYLPDIRNRLMSGVAETTQDGARPITTVGSASLNVEHKHQWYKRTASGSADQSYDSAGSLHALSFGATKDGVSYGLWSGDSSPYGINADQYTETVGLTSISLLPESIPLEIYMRIVE